MHLLLERSRDYTGIDSATRGVRDKFTAMRQLLQRRAPGDPVSILAVLLMRALSNLSWTSGLIAGRTSPGVILQGFAIAIIVGVLGAAYPAYRAASLSPMEALRKK